MEYLLLLCSVMAVALIVGGFLHKKIPDLMDRIGIMMLNSVLTAVSP
ncbi:MAG: hypothetical protein HY925_16165 [Elusimicrobia bacterium]|nr:hypothetical protein [Elusimicrobiota bacterium]